MPKSTGRLLHSHDGQRYRFDPGALCLDLLLSGGEGIYAQWESLRVPDDMGRWIAGSPLAAVAPIAPEDVLASTADVGAARALRASIRRAVDALIDGRPAAPEDLAVIREAAAAPPPAPTLGAGAPPARGWRVPIWGYQVVSAWARDAIDVLTGPLAGRVRRCAAEDCAHVFADTSRPGARRWCAMERCGNRDKQRRFQERRRPHAQ